MLESSNHLTGRGITGFERWLLLSAVAIPSDGKAIAGEEPDAIDAARGFVTTLGCGRIN